MTASNQGKVPLSQQRAMQYFVQAKVFEKQKNPLGAIVSLRSAADLDPTSPMIFERLAHNYEKIQDYRQAIVFATRALKLDPELSDLRLQLIRWHESMGDPVSAAKQLEQLIDRQPARWPLYSHLARLYVESGESERIDRLFDELLKRSDTPSDIKVNIAYIMSRGGRVAEAEAIFLRVLNSDPELEDAWIGLAELHLSNGDAEQGIQFYIEAAKRLPDNIGLIQEIARHIEKPDDLKRLDTVDATFLYRLGVALSDNEKYYLAAHIFEQIVELGPQDVEAWLDPVRYYLHVGDDERAQNLLREAAESMPDSVDIYLFWGQVLEELGRVDEAIGVYRSGVQRKPRNIDLLEHWGFALEQQELYDEAIEVYQNGIADGASPDAMYIRWGIVLGRQKRWQEAVGRYSKAVEFATDDRTKATAYLHWGIALERMNRWQAAVDILTQASDIDRSDTRNLFYLGSCLEQASRVLPDSVTYFDRAIVVFERLIALDSQDAYALNYLGYMYADRGVHLHEAVELLMRALTIDPTNGAFFDSLGWAYYRLGDLAQAEHFLAKALDHLKDHENAEQSIIYDHAGDVAKVLGKDTEAIKYWRRALDLSPENKELKQKLDRTIP
tara:strand:- start:176 stop:2014 length:1839 start_codon:yes stop_codon:yes gene_type:complete